jgi:hypothetical protein
MNLEDFPDDYQRQIRRKIGVPASPPVQSADLECPSGTGPLATGAGAALDTLGRVRIRCLSRRHRLADSDGISYKAIIDSLVLERVIEDDGPKYVESVEMRQEKIPMGDPEETVIELYEVEAPC